MLSTYNAISQLQNKLGTTDLTVTVEGPYLCITAHKVMGTNIGVMEKVLVDKMSEYLSEADQLNLVVEFMLEKFEVKKPSNRRKSPYKDPTGKDIFEGSIVQHPHGARGVVRFLPNCDVRGDEWVVAYDDSPVYSYLRRQGQARVVG